MENSRGFIIEDNGFPWNSRGLREKMVWNSRGGGGVKNEIEFQGVWLLKMVILNRGVTKNFWKSPLFAKLNKNASVTFFLFFLERSASINNSIRIYHTRSHTISFHVYYCGRYYACLRWKMCKTWRAGGGGRLHLRGCNLRVRRNEGVYYTCIVRCKMCKTCKRV